MPFRALTRSSFENLMHAAPGAILAIDTSGIIIAANEAAAQVCGYQLTELTGQNFNVLLPRQYRSQHEKLFKTFLSYPERRLMGTGRDFELVQKSGGLVPVEIGLEPCLVDTSFITLVTLIDIAERKTAERYRGAFLRACGKLDGFESVGLAAAVVDSDGAILAFNRYFEQRKALVVDGIAAVVQRRYLKALKSVFESGKPHGIRVTLADDSRPTVVLLIPAPYDTARPEPAASFGLILIHSSRQIEPIGSDLLKQVFGLTTAEAKVAAFLARGARVSEIAFQLDVSRETIRTELSHIFSKTGSSGQIELVTLLAPFIKQ
jgi:PAS domain S-box-containing protein